MSGKQLRSLLKQKSESSEQHQAMMEHAKVVCSAANQKIHYGETYTGTSLYSLYQENKSQEDVRMIMLIMCGFISADPKIARAFPLIDSSGFKLFLNCSLVRALVEHDRMLTMDMYGSDSSYYFEADAGLAYQTSLFKSVSQAGDLSWQVRKFSRKQTYTFTVITMAKVLGLDSLLPNNTRDVGFISCIIFGRSPLIIPSDAREMVAKFGYKWEERIKKEFPEISKEAFQPTLKTEVIATRLIQVMVYGLEKNIHYLSLIHAVSSIKFDSSLPSSAMPTQPIQSPPAKEPVSPEQTNIRIFRVGGSDPSSDECGRSHQTLKDSNAVLISKNLQPLEVHTNSTINPLVIQSWETMLKEKRLTSLLPSEIGDNPIFEVLKLQLPLDNGRETETFAFGARDVFSQCFREELLSSIDDSCFIESSPEIGNGSKDRYYRVAQGCHPHSKEGGMFLLSNDGRPIDSDQMTPSEAKLVNFMSELLGVQDDIVSEHAKPGSFVMQWVPKRTVIPTMVAPRSDSAYSWHKDVAFHHCHNLPTLDGSSDDFEKELFMELPEVSFMRVFTVIISGVKGDNAKLVFQKDGDTDPIGGGLTTNHSSFHIQGYGIQKSYRHSINELPILASHRYDHVPDRIVITGRQNLPGGNSKLSIYSAGLSDQNTSDLFSPRRDYTVKGVLSYTQGRSELIHISNNTGKRPTADNSSEDEHSKRMRLLAEQREIHEHGSNVEAVAITELAQKHSWDDWSERGPVNCTLANRSVHQQKTNPPGGNALEWYEDAMKLSERLLHKNFVEYFFGKNRRLRIESPSGTGDDAILRTAVHGATLSMDVLCNPGLNMTSPNTRPIVPGDVIVESKVRSALGLSASQQHNSLWDTDPYLANSAILSKYFYKDDLTGISQIVNHLDTMDGTFDGLQELSFWMAGSGGSAQPCGQTCVSTSSLETNRPKPKGNFPHPMNPRSDLNAAMNICASREQVLYIFIPTSHETSEIHKRQAKEHGKEPVLNTAKKTLQFLGLYYVSGSEQCSDKPDHFIEAMKARKEENSDDSWWNFSFRLSPHFRFTMKPLDVQWSNFMNNTHSPTELPLRLDGVLSSRKLQCVLRPGESILTVMKRDGGFVKNILIPMFEEQFLESLESGEGLFQRSDVMNQTIEDTGDDEDNGLIPKVPHILRSKGKVNVGVAELVSSMTRVSMAGVYRALGYSTIEKNPRRRLITKVGYLPDNNDALRKLGDVVRSSPMPMPNRGLDLTTSFAISLIMGSYPEIFKCRGREVEHGCILSPQETHRLPLNVVNDVLSTFFITRLTGRVEQLRKYLVETKPAGSSGWRRCFSFDDYESLGLYLVAIDRNMNGTGLRNKASAGKKLFNVLGPFATTQYRKSLPKCSTLNVRKFWKFLRNARQKLESLAQNIHTCAPTRKAVITGIKDVISSSSGSQEEEANCEFVAGQITSDLEEVLSGLRDNGVPTKPFLQNYTVIGYGGGEGLNVMRKGMGVKKNDVDEVTNKYLEGLRKQHSLVLKAMGFFYDSRIGEVCSVVNGHRIGPVTVEHKGCKVYILLHRCRGTRYYSIPSPWRPHCWPSIDTDVLTSELRRLFWEMVKAFEESVLEGILPELHPMFEYPKESNKDSGSSCSSEDDSCSSSREIACGALLELQKESNGDNTSDCATDHSMLVEHGEEEQSGFSVEYSGD